MKYCWVLDEHQNSWLLLMCMEWLHIEVHASAVVFGCSCLNQLALCVNRSNTDSACSRLPQQQFEDVQPKTLSCFAFQFPSSRPDCCLISCIVRFLEAAAHGAQFGSGFRLALLGMYAASSVSNSSWHQRRCLALDSRPIFRTNKNSRQHYELWEW